MASGSPTDQRAGVRPISFLLDDAGTLSPPVNLAIRPEDLTRTEPSRVAVHQTLGKTQIGWADWFGEGLPSVTIAGHTGWRRPSAGGADGFGSFEALNTLVQHRFAAAKQTAIEQGKDPAEVKLLFLDMLDNFSWSVVPTSFVLRRSRSRPLLYQYNISLQAVSTTIEDPFSDAPALGSLSGGLAALESAISAIENLAAMAVGFINDAVAFVSGAVSMVAEVVGVFTGLANRVLNAAYSVIDAVAGGAATIASDVIGIANDIAAVGTNLFRTVSAAVNLPVELRAQVARVASAYNEVACIFGNALKPKRAYEDYEGLYGASNCSSTTGGRPPSPYSNANPFSAMRPQASPVQVSSVALASIAAVKASDPVLAPMSLPELSAHIGQINSGVGLQ